MTATDGARSDEDADKTSSPSAHTLKAEQQMRKAGRNLAEEYGDDVPDDLGHLELATCIEDAYQKAVHIVCEGQREEVDKFERVKDEKIKAFQNTAVADISPEKYIDGFQYALKSAVNVSCTRVTRIDKEWKQQIRAGLASLASDIRASKKAKTQVAPLKTPDKKPTAVAMSFSEENHDSADEAVSAEGCRMDTREEELNEAHKLSWPAARSMLGQAISSMERELNAEFVEERSIRVISEAIKASRSTVWIDNWFRSHPIPLTPPEPTTSAKGQSGRPKRAASKKQVSEDYSDYDEDQATKPKAKRASRSAKANDSNTGPDIIEKTTPREAPRMAGPVKPSEREKGKQTPTVETKEAKSDKLRQRLKRQLEKDPNWRFLVQDSSKINDGITYTLKLLWTFVARAPHDLTALVRILAQTWKRHVPVNNYEARVTSGMESLDRKYKGIAATELSEGPIGLVKYMDFAIDYRMKQKTKTKEELDEFHKSHPECEEWVRIGTIIMHLNYCLTPRSTFGLLILHLMGLNPHKVGQMEEDHRVIFMGIVSPHAASVPGSVNRGVPRIWACIVDVIVERLIPMLEHTFCYNLRHCQDALISVFACHFVVPAGDDDIYNFGINIFNDGPLRPATETLFRPSLEILAGVYKIDNGLLKLANAHYRIEHEAHEKRPEEADADMIQKIKEYQDFFHVTRDQVDRDQSQYAKRLKRPVGVLDELWKSIHPQILFQAGCVDLDDLKGIRKCIKYKFTSALVNDEDEYSFNVSGTRPFVTRTQVLHSLTNERGQLLLPTCPGLLIESNIDISDAAFRKKRKGTGKKGTKNAAKKRKSAGKKKAVEKEDEDKEDDGDEDEDDDEIEEDGDESGTYKPRSNK